MTTTQSPVMKPTCCAYISMNGWSRGHCGKPSKIEHEGRHYCGIHNPVTKASKEAAKDAEKIAMWADEKAVKEKARAVQKELERRAACFDDLLFSLKQLLEREWQDDEDAPTLQHARLISKAAILKAELK